MRDSDPILLLRASVDRDSMLAELRRLRAMAIDELRTLSRGRAMVADGPERLAIVADPAAVHASLDLAIERLPSVTRPRFAVRPQGVYFSRGATPGRIAFLFPGQGSEHVGMLRTLHSRVPAVRGWFDALDRAADALSAPALTPLIFGEPRDDDRAGAGRLETLRSMELGAQLGTVADLALHEVLGALGVRADAHVGHSNGEHAAVIAAGMAGLDDRDELCRWFVRLGRAGAERPARARPEALVAVSAVSRERLAALLGARPGELQLAMDNCPNQLVVGGFADAVDAFRRDVVSAGGVAMPLPFSRAYHTPLFRDWAETFGAHYRELALGPGRVPVYSCLTTQPLPTEPERCRRTMTDQWTSVVRFRSTVEAMHDAGVRVFVEVGPQSRLTAFVEDTLRGRPHVAVSASSPQRDEIAQLCHLMGELFVAGVTLDPSSVARLSVAPAPLVVAPMPRRSAAPAVSLRNLPAQVHGRLIADARARLARAEAAVRGLSFGAWPLLQSVDTTSPGRLMARRRLTRRDDPFVEDHALGRRGGAAGYPLPVLPFTLSLEIAAEAACRLTGKRPTQILGARASRWLALDAGELTVDIEADGRSDGVHVRLSEAAAAVPAPAFQAVVSADRSSPIRLDADPQARTPIRWDARSFYERYAFHGRGFQGLSTVTAVGPSGIEAELTITENAGLPATALLLDPAMLDCAGQLVAFWLLEQHERAPTFGIFPFSVRRVTLERAPLDPGARIRCRGVLAFDGQATEASFTFDSFDGERLASVEGLEQRLVEFPAWLAEVVFGSGPVGPRPGPSRGVAAADREVLTASWGIWERALAHLCLAPEDLAAWRRMPGADARRVDWLLSRLAGGGDRETEIIVNG